jgi:hypothetical protein
MAVTQILHFNLNEGALKTHATVRRGNFDPGDRLKDLYL